MKKIPALNFMNKSRGGGLVLFSDILARQGMGHGRKYHFAQFPPDWNELESYAEEKKFW